MEKNQQLYIIADNLSGKGKCEPQLEPPEVQGSPGVLANGQQGLVGFWFGI